MQKQLSATCIKPYVSSVFLFVCLSSCLTPKRSFDKLQTPKAPDYSKNSTWAALPETKDFADKTVLKTTMHDEQANAQVDVFFIHPTSYVAGRHWNASLSYKSVNKRTNKGAIKYQASVFNGSCKVYAPRYRQAVLYAYLDKKGNAPKAFDTAYSDVKRAFEYYLKHYNHGRPIIIASHSQGTDHAMRLMHDFFDNDSTLRKKLVAAYLIGRPIKKNSLNNIPICDSANQIGCLIAWNTMKWGSTKLFHEVTTNLVCTNPLTWKNNTQYADAKLNTGSVRVGFKRMDKGLIDAKCSDNGILWIHMPFHRGYPKMKHYHVMDYNLFYMNIRENIQLRIDTYFKNQKQ